jgi:PAS domain S-box-containing protein
MPREGRTKIATAIAVCGSGSTRTARTWRTSVETKVPIDIEYRLETANAGYRWVLSRAVARLDESGQVVRWYGTLEDVHDRKLAEHALRDSEERFRLAAQAAGLGIWDYNASDDRREWSEEFKAMLGLPIDAAPSIDTALSCVVPDDRSKLLDLIAAVRAGHSGHRFETMVRIRRVDTGAELWMKTAGWRIEAPLGRLHRVLVTVRDVTEERNVEDRIRWTAEHDGMTRLPNRTAFGDNLERAIATAVRNRAQVALTRDGSVLSTAAWPRFRAARSGAEPASSAAKRRDRLRRSPIPFRTRSFALQ